MAILLFFGSAILFFVIMWLAGVDMGGGGQPSVDE
jgi:hypothetical protein